MQNSTQKIGRNKYLDKIQVYMLPSLHSSEEHKCIQWYDLTDLFEMDGHNQGSSLIWKKENKITEYWCEMSFFG